MLPLVAFKVLTVMETARPLTTMPPTDPPLTAATRT
jgi:hypothetical protein